MIANPAGTLFSRYQGFVATATAALSGDSTLLDLSTFRLGIPYYALNLAPTSGQMNYSLLVTIDVFLDSFGVAKSPPVAFTDMVTLVRYPAF